MAEIVRYVNTASSAGGDGTTNATTGDNRAYASLGEMEAAEDTDLTDNGGDYLTVYCEGADADAVNWAFSGWVTSATCYIDLVVTQANRHDGKWNTGKYRLAGQSSRPTNYTADLRFTGFQIDFGAGANFFDNRAEHACDYQFDACIIKSSTGTHMVNFADGTYGAGSKVRIRNSLLYDATGTAAINFSEADVSFWIHNCTITDSTRGIRLSVAVASDNVKNCLFSNITSDDFYANPGYWTDDDAQNDYNRTTTNTAHIAFGSHGAINQSVTFVDTDSDNWHLQAGDTGAQDLGTDLSGDSDWPVTYDIDGEERTGTYDVGADEYVAVGGETLVMSDLAHTHSLDIPTLTQKHTIAVGALEHSHSLDNVSLTQKHSIIVNALEHSHVLDVPVLTQKHIIAVAGLEHSHSLDAPVLTQAHLLAIAGLEHSHALDNVTLTQAHLLALAGLDHGHALDNVALTQAHILANVADLTHSHSLDNIVLSLAGVLVVNSLTHGHSLDTPTLTQKHTLTVADLAHAHALDAIDLSFGVTLVVNDLTHVQSLDGVDLLQAHVLIVDGLGHSHTIGSVILQGIDLIEIQELVSKGHLSIELVAAGSLSQELVSKGHLSQELISIMGDIS